VAFRCDRSRKIEMPTSWRLPVLPQSGDWRGAGGVGTRLAVLTRHQLADPASAHPLLCLSTGCAGGTLGSVARAVSFRRLSRLTDEVFGLTISEGASANILVRTEAPLLAATTPIAAAVRTSPVVGSDQTSARVRGKTWWQGMLLITNAIHHVIGDTGAASVVTTFLDGAQPEKWVADHYGGQLGHGAVRQMCLAHCYVTRSMRSKPATPCSRRGFDGCCCALWPSADDARH
jgi:hypothetical protein